MAFRQCFLNFFFDTPEVTKIVLPKVLQNFKDAKLYLLVQGTEPKRFHAYHTIPDKIKGSPFQFFLALRDFFPGKIPQRVPLQFFGVLQQNGC